VSVEFSGIRDSFHDVNVMDRHSITVHHYPPGGRQDRQPIAQHGRYRDGPTWLRGANVAITQPHAAEVVIHLQ